MIALTAIQPTLTLSYASHRAAGAVAFLIGEVAARAAPSLVINQSVRLVVTTTAP